MRGLRLQFRALFSAVPVERGNEANKFSFWDGGYKLGKLNEEENFFCYNDSAGGFC